MIAIITGRGKFPIDMLRYDSCYPASEMDSIKIMTSHEEYCKWSIRVAKRPINRQDDFTIARWESFGCNVEIVN